MAKNQPQIKWRKNKLFRDLKRKNHFSYEIYVNLAAVNFPKLFCAFHPALNKLFECIIQKANLFTLFVCVACYACEY